MLRPQDKAGVPARWLNRRQFLKTAALAAAAPAIVPARVFGAEAPSNRINIGLIGLGRIMEGHQRWFLSRSDVQVVAVCDAEGRRLKFRQELVDEHYGGQRASGAYRGCAAYHDFRELLARDDIDAVVIGTPDHWHALIAVAAAKAGKDIYCEKPLSYSVQEGRAMVDAVRRYGRVFQTGSQQRSERGFRVACELVRNGRIGKVHTLHVNVGGPPVECNLPAEPAPPELDWDLWLGPAPWRPFHSELAPPMEFTGWPNWRAYRDYSGGAMTDWGAHHFDIAQWGLGMDGSGPVEVIPPDGDAVPLLTYKYPNGVTMHRGGGEWGRSGVEFIGEHGRIMVGRGVLEADPPELLDEPAGPDDIRLYESRGHAVDWLECIRTRQRPICDVEIGHSSCNVCHIGNIAYRLKRTLKWDPEAERFEDDDEANRLLMRPMRGEWRV